MNSVKDNWPWRTRKAMQPLNIIIIGAGIGGLTSGIALAQTGHDVTIMESSVMLSEVGAGIQLPPNSTRILHRLGVLSTVLKHSTILESVSVRRYDNDAEIACLPLMPSVGSKYGAPMCVIHRGDLQRILLQTASRLGCRILTGHNARVTDADPGCNSKVKTLDRYGNIRTFTADLIIAADGIRSQTREQLAGTKTEACTSIPTRDAAYRLLIHKDKIKQDPDLLSMVQSNSAVRYMGPGGHVIGYPVRNNNYYNLVLIHRAPHVQKGKDQWTTRTSRSVIESTYANWSPMIKKWISFADEKVYEWRLDVYPELASWTKGNVALLGDACHPMLPYVAQGAANAIEDAACLATALTCTSDIPSVLKIYESVRKRRAEIIAATATETAAVLHLPDGPEQRERDERMKLSNSNGKCPDKWSDLAFQDFVWGVDITEETECACQHLQPLPSKGVTWSLWSLVRMLTHVMSSKFLF